MTAPIDLIRDALAPHAVDPDAAAAACMVALRAAGMVVCPDASRIQHLPILEGALLRVLSKSPNQFIPTQRIIGEIYGGEGGPLTANVIISQRACGLRKRGYNIAATRGPGNGAYALITTGGAA